MIDEELYQQAADELSSDKRKAGIWARACALASDDHDEARYLYTNLRVEQLMAEKAEFSANASLGGGVPSPQALADAELGVNDLEFEYPESDASPLISSQRTGQSTRASIPLSIDDLPDIADGELDRPASVRGNTDSLEFKSTELDLDPTEIIRMNDENDGSGNTIYGKNADVKQNMELAADSRTENQIDAAEEQIKRLKSNAPPRHGIDSHAVTSVSESQTDAIESELERQAEELPGQQSDTVAISPTSDVGTHAEARRSDEVRSDYADQNLPGIEPDDTHLQTGSERSFLVFSRDGLPKAVKQGVSWPALFFTLPWLLSRRLFGTAIVYALLWIALIAGLLSTGFAWLDAGDTATTTIKLWTAGFAVLSVIGLIYIPFRYGNEWCTQKLEDRGFELQAHVNARNQQDAIAQTTRFAP